jgi:DNA ligase 1
MKFHRFAEYLSELEQTSLRNSMVSILSKLFHEADKEDVDKICYLTQGRVAPLFSPIEFGIADKLMIRAISQAYGISITDVTREFSKSGDLGTTAEKLKEESKKKLKLFEENNNKNFDNVTISEVFDVLSLVAHSFGNGSQEKKLTLLSDLLEKVDGLSARYIVRIPLDKLRLGFSDMTVLQALAVMISSEGSMENVDLRREIIKIKEAIEQKYNVRPDLGYIAQILKEKGFKGLNHILPVPGTPIQMARAERLPNPVEIIKKIGRCSIEPKYDGFRLQVHIYHDKKKEIKVILFTRSLEDVTYMYPDILLGIKEQIHCDSAIIEGEAIGYNPLTHEYLPFQETVQRKRKYDISAKSLEIPLRLFAFEVLYVDGKSLLDEPYNIRRKMLEKIVKKGNTIEFSEQYVVDTAEELDKIFLDSVSRGLEGIMAKKLDGNYQAGARGFNWIKYKRSYSGKLTDTVDAVVMGYDFGQGKRAGFGIGDFLIGVYDEKEDLFKTVAKIGTGLTDDEWRKVQKMGQELKTNKKPARYDVDKAMECSVWMTPKLVVVIKADEITLSPTHTAGRVMALTKSGNSFEVKTPGFALRFPRLVDFRTDKKPEDTTTLLELKDMFELQGKAKEIR